MNLDEPRKHGKNEDINEPGNRKDGNNPSSPSTQRLCESFSRLSRHRFRCLAVRSAGLWFVSLTFCGWSAWEPWPQNRTVWRNARWKANGAEIYWVFCQVLRCLSKEVFEVKLPTIWTDEKQRWEESAKRREEERRSKKRKSQKKEDPSARKGRKVMESHETLFFQ